MTKTLSEQDALKYVLDALHRHCVNDTYPDLKFNFPDYEPSILFRTLVLQQCWVDICNNNINDAIVHTQELGESPGQNFYQMWKQTTRNKARQLLYEYLHKQSLLSEKDEENYSILLKLINSKKEEPQPKKQKSFFSFTPKSKSETSSNPSDNGFYSQNQQSIMKAFCDTLKELTENDSDIKFEANESMTNNFNENKTMIFPGLFNKLIPKEPPSNSFIGSIVFIESQPPKIIKYLKTNQGSTVERLWILHCEQKIPEMQQIFNDDISNYKINNQEMSLKNKKIFPFQHQFPSSHSVNQPPRKQKKLKCLKFCNLYSNQMNEYEKESLFDILAVNGFFCDCELNSIEKLLYRICKNKLLFDQNWWTRLSTIRFDIFFKNFSKFCSTHNLYLPFEIFVLNHPNAKELDLSNDPDFEQHPLIRFIWDLWIKRDPFSASVSNFQYLSPNEGSPMPKDDFEILMNNLPDDSLAPLSLFIYNKDTKRFLPNSPESLLLSTKLSKKYPLLSSLVKGETPHPVANNEAIRPPPNDKKFRFLLYTSKFDLELHETIVSHFTQYDFSKVFTTYYGDDKFKGQPNYPHFDHPELILSSSSPSDSPYLYYVKSLLPVSAFQQATNDDLSEESFREICLKCMKESLVNKTVRLSCLTFIELTDYKFKSDMAVDFKLAVSIFDRLTQLNEQPPTDLNSFLSVDMPDPLSLVGPSMRNLMKNDSNSNSFNDLIIAELSKVFEFKSQESAKFLQQKLHPSNVDVLLLSLLVGIRCNRPPDYGVIDVLASKMHPAELILFIDRAEEIGARYDMKEVAKIIKEKMPSSSLKEPILFLLTQELPSIYNNLRSEDQANNNDSQNTSTEIEPALVVYKALRNGSKDEHLSISLLNESLMRHDPFYSAIASSVDGADNSMCALVTLMTMTDAFSFDVSHPPDADTRSRLFLEVINQLLLDGKSDDVLKSVELFSKESIILPIVDFYNSVFIFAFKRAQLSFERFSELIKKCQNNGKHIDDDLLGKIAVDDILSTLFPLQEQLAKHCSDKSQVHLYRYLQLLNDRNDSDLSLVSSFLRSRVRLAETIDKFDSFRKTLLQCNLIGDKKKLVADLIAHHSLSLGEAAAKCFELDPSQFIGEWVKKQFLAASTPEEVLKVHSRVTQSLMHPDSLNNECCDSFVDEYSDDDEVEDDFGRMKAYVDPLFYVSLFASMIQFVLPSKMIHVIEFANKLLKDSDINGSFLSSMKSLTLSLKLFGEHSIDSAILMQARNTNSYSSKESVSSILHVLFPAKESDKNYNTFVDSIPTEIPLNLTSPVQYSVESIRDLFSLSIDNVIDTCLEERGLDEAKMLCESQNRNSQTIVALEALKILFEVFNSKSSHVVHIIDDDDGDHHFFTARQKEILVSHGMKSSNFKEKTPDCFFIDSVEAREVQDVLSSMASKKQNRLFNVISLHFQGTAILRSYAESDPLYKAKSSPLVRPSLLLGKSSTERSLEFLKSPLPTMVNHIDLTRKIIEIESIPPDTVSRLLASNLVQTVVGQKERVNSNISFVLVDDFGAKFSEFAGLCSDPSLIGDALLSYASRQINGEVNDKDVKIEVIEKRVDILVNILLHASLCSSKIEDCAKLLDSLYGDDKSLVESEEVHSQILKIVKNFPEPSMLPRFIKYVYKMNEDNIDAFQQSNEGEISQKLCLEILNEARLTKYKNKKFQPEKFFNITLACKLYYEHARLQAEAANLLLSQIVNIDPQNHDDDIDDSETSESISTSGSEVDLIPQDKRELRRLKKIEKQKQKEEKIELKKLKKKEKSNKNTDKQETLQEVSRHFLLALAYSLHEKCYHLSMECLKKLSLISLQKDLINTGNGSISNSASNLIASQNDKNLNVFGLTEKDVLFLMQTREFPFALTIAISYDMDNEINWSKSLFAQSIEKQGDDFLAAFLYFKPMTVNLYNGVVERYKEYFESKERSNVTLDNEVKERMKLFLMKIPNLVERYRLYKKLNFKDLAENMREKHPVICEWCDKVI